MTSQPTDMYIRVFDLPLSCRHDLTLLSEDIGVANKDPREDYFDDVLGTEVSDVTFTSISGCVGACYSWSM